MLEIINKNNIKDEDVSETNSKARVILKDEYGNIMISNYGGVFLFPGGSIEQGEDPYLAIIRELKEETGIDYKIGDLEELAVLEHFQYNYPKRDGNITNRKITTYYFYGKSKGIDYNHLNLTDGEKKDHFYSLFISKDELLDLIEVPTSTNPRYKYFKEEIEHILNIYDETLKIKKQVVRERKQKKEDQ